MYMSTIITSSEFRQSMKRYFREVVEGEELFIENGMVLFQLVFLPFGRKVKEISPTIISKTTPVVKPLPEDVTIVSSSDVPQSKENFDKGNIYQLKAVKTSDPTKQAVCKIHGTPLDFRGRCLQKGCKYA